MAGYDLIELHLDAVARRLAWRPDVDELVDELRDHMYTAADRLVGAEIDGAEAERLTIERFGESSTIAVSFASAGTTGLAVPTSFTRTAGRLALVAAGVWPLLAVAWLASDLLERSSGRWEGAPEILFMNGAAALLTAATITCIVLVGLHRRHGGLGVVGVTGIILCGLGAATAPMLSWFVQLWGGLIAAGVLLVSAPVIWRGIAPRGSAIVFAFAGVAGWVTGVVAWTLRVGPEDDWGSYPVAIISAVGVATVGWAIGLVGFGRWLRGEDPVDAPEAVAG